MKTRKHITEGERWKIHTLLGEGYDQEVIALKIGRPPGTLSKELKRNSINGVYMPAHAQREYERRRSEINKGHSKLKTNQDMIQEIKRYLIEEKWAPDSISGRKKVSVCTQTIYSYIHVREPSLKKYLKYKRGYKKPRKVAREPKENYKTISERPIEIETRTRVGDMEVDTIHSSGSERKGGVVTIVDRKSKFLCGDKVDRRTALEVGNVLIQQMKSLPKEKLLSITADNGKEFNDFVRVESALNTLVYFANPYSSYERGTNEQTNGMIRRFYPKGTDFSKISSAEIQETMRIINRKPRKSLHYLCAYEAFYEVSLDL